VPLIDIQFVCMPGCSGPPVSAQAVSDAMGQVFASPPGRTWVRLHLLPFDCYAENDVKVDAGELPVFVTVLHAHPPAGEALTRELAAITAAVAKCAGIAPQQVHVQYLPPGAGRQAFGGRLVD
jgi:hypothetical protein